MCYVEPSRGIAVEECFKNLFRLILAGIAGVGYYGNLQAVVKPRREFLRISKTDVLGNRNEHIVPLILGRCHMSAAAERYRSR